jgi:hypothetical protein
MWSYCQIITLTLRVMTNDEHQNNLETKTFIALKKKLLNKDH